LRPNLASAAAKISRFDRFFTLAHKRKMCQPKATSRGSRIWARALSPFFGFGVWTVPRCGRDLSKINPNGFAKEILHKNKLPAFSQTD
jgi:hypothetical protein